MVVGFDSKMQMHRAAGLTSALHPTAADTDAPRLRVNARRYPGNDE